MATLLETEIERFKKHGFARVIYPREHRILDLGVANLMEALEVNPDIMWGRVGKVRHNYIYGEQYISRLFVGNSKWNGTKYSVPKRATIIELDKSKTLTGVEIGREGPPWEIDPIYS